LKHLRLELVLCLRILRAGNNFDGSINERESNQPKQPQRRRATKISSPSTMHAVSNKDAASDTPIDLQTTNNANLDKAQ
jgi:hypothetical protein